ncbi:MAG TPA: alpha/beta hydrolase, partial [Candidatus Dormibacteraeota bacterium]|nr:alpha/beta hydrolase [Candidatus Dormibacteraeota bacterium]
LKDIEEARKFNGELEALIATVPPVISVPPDVSRKLRREGKGIFPAPVFLDDARDVEVAGRSGPIRVRVIRPEGRPTGIYLHIHGGGWTLGAHDMQDVALKQLADQTGLCAASIDYRLSPEHPYPAGPDDCEDAVIHLLEHGAQLLEAPARFAIGGESAGAHLAVVTLLRLRDRHGFRGRIAAANLAYGDYDLNGTPSQLIWGDRNLVLSTPIIRWFCGNFLPEMTFEQRRDPDVSPLYARLDRMPPALFSVGTLDPLIDDSTFMYERWRGAGNQAELAIFPEGVHAFNQYPTGLARKGNARQVQFLREVFA